MRLRSLALAACLLIPPAVVLGQDSLRTGEPWTSGIEARFGIGQLGLRDEHISTENYGGPVEQVAVSWSHVHETYGFQMGLEYAWSTRLKNYNVSSEARTATVHLADIYPVGSFEAFDRHATVFLGPRLEVFTYYRRQDIARNPDATPSVYESGIWLASMGISGGITAPVLPHIDLQVHVNLSLLSIGGGTGSDAGNFTNLTLLTPFAAVRSTLGIGFGYVPLSWLFVRIGYGLDLTNVSSWNRVLIVRDDLILAVGFTL